MKKKNTKIWITLLWLPFVSLILVAIMQVVAQFVFSTVEGINSTPTVISIISILVGIFAVFGIILMPIWIIMLVVASNHNKKIAEQPQQNINSSNNIIDLG